MNDEELLLIASSLSDRFLWCFTFCSIFPLDKRRSESFCSISGENSVYLWPTLFGRTISSSSATVTSGKLSFSDCFLSSLSPSEASSALGRFEVSTCVVSAYGISSCYILREIFIFTLCFYTSLTTYFYGWRRYFCYEIVKSINVIFDESIFFISIQNI